MAVIENDETCTQCGEEPKLRTCIDCGTSAETVDCGHQDQPRPLAVDPDGEVRCEECTQVQ